MILALAVGAKAFLQGELLAFRKSFSLQLMETKNEEKILYMDDDTDESKKAKIRKARWESLSPKVQDEIRKEAQNRAIRNKKKRESTADKKRSECLPLVLFRNYADVLLIMFLFLVLSNKK